MRTLLSFGSSSLAFSDLGLRIELVLYTVYADQRTLAALLDGDVALAPGQFTEDRILWKQHEIKSDAADSASTPDHAVFFSPDGPADETPPRWRTRHTLAVLDYEWGDAHPAHASDSALRALHRQMPWTAAWAPEHGTLQAVARFVAGERRARVYRAVPLDEVFAAGGGARRVFRRLVAGVSEGTTLVRVMRPARGWDAAEAVFVR